MQPGRPAVMLALFLLGGISPVFGAGSRQLSGHVPAAVKNLAATGVLPATNELSLALGVPLRDAAGLDNFLAALYDPASPSYRQFLTVAEFTARFGPTAADYAAVQNFARTNGFTITGTHGNRLVLDVRGRVADIERTFHLKLRKYRHPTEAREFFAPDAEPVVAADLPVMQVSGLDNYTTKQALSVVRPLAANEVVPQNGSGTGGLYLGNDFRNAYAPGVTQTGSGQSVALVQFDGYYTNDIAAYLSAAGLTGTFHGNITNIPVAGGVTNVGSQNGEVCLDIDMVIVMAPGISNIFVYETTTNTSWPTILNAIVSDTNHFARQISCSWSDKSPSALNTNTTSSEIIFKEMAAQGQSFFTAAGDSGAYVAGVPFPVESTNVTAVGGTVLTMNGTGASYASETVWYSTTTNIITYVTNSATVTNILVTTNSSGGGISTNYPIPGWQQGISMVTNHGSTTMRNVPDVALTANNVYCIFSNGIAAVFGGTSCSAPLWAGFMALANQQATAYGNPGVGLINPLIYSLGKSTNYNLYFHDITTGSNTWSSSLTNFYAVPGYDLCTGWGTPAGSNLIYALAVPLDSLSLTPAAGFAASGLMGGPFTGGSQTLTLTNLGTNSLSWSLINTSAWLTVSNASGTLAGGSHTNITASLATAANSLLSGSYSTLVLFSNQTTHIVQPRSFTLQVLLSLALTPTNGFTGIGPVGGNFSVSSRSYVVTNLNPSAVKWGIVNTSAWLTATPPVSTLAANAATALTISLNAAANALPPGIYSANILVTNQGTVAANLAFGLQVGQQLVQNGGFEAGTTNGVLPINWTIVDASSNGSANDYVDNGTYSPITPHSGTYYFLYTQSSPLAYLSQTLATIPGQTYLLSFWLTNVVGSVGSSNILEQFQVNWITNLTGTNTVLNLTNPPAFGWTNYLFTVTATGTNTTLQFAADNTPGFFGLDDITVTPVPSPAVIGFSKRTNGFSLTWNSLTGLVYQVEYKTNLLQSGWKTNAIITATNLTTSFVTNTFSADPRRFYRIGRRP